jgi:hypothetical protein
LTATHQEGEHIKPQPIETEPPAEEKKQKPRTKKSQPKPAEPAKEVFGADTVLEQEQEHIAPAQDYTLPEQAVTLATLLPAETLLIVIDKALSVILPLALNSLAGTKLRPSDMKLSAEEKRTMKPAIEAAAKTIKLNFNNPWVVLGITTVAVYGAKAAAVINFDNVDADDLGAGDDRPKRKSTGAKRERDYAAEYARRQAREGRR